MIKFETLTLGRYPDYLAPNDCTHVVHQSTGYSFWKLEGDKYFKWVGDEQWVLYEVVEDD